jgi:hypothetical protein
VLWRPKECILLNREDASMSVNRRVYVPGNDCTMSTNKDTIEAAMSRAMQSLDIMHALTSATHSTDVAAAQHWTCLVSYDKLLTLTSSWGATTTQPQGRRTISTCPQDLSIERKPTWLE